MQVILVNKCNTSELRKSLLYVICNCKGDLFKQHWKLNDFAYLMSCWYVSNISTKYWSRLDENHFYTLHNYSYSSHSRNTFLFLLLTITVMMTSSNGNIFRVTCTLYGEFTSHRWFPRTKASDAQLWCFLWSSLEATVEQTMETPVIWDAIALIEVIVMANDVYTSA